jgi:large conductance mechanosensitive channel
VPSLGSVDTVITKSSSSIWGAAVLKGFKDFILRGNVMDLAVALVIGLAFTAVVNALVDYLITPIVAAIFGEPDLDSVATFTINNATFSIGAILTAVINFLLVAAAVYFVLVVPMNRLAERRAAGQDAPPEAPTEDVLLLRQIRDLLQQRQPD